jgi:hypothetical protein
MVSPMGMASWYNQFTGMSLPDQFAGIHTPTRLRSHNKSVMSGLYVGRGPAGRAIYAEALAETTEGDAENKWAHGAPYDTVKQTQFAGFGCMLVHRQVFLDIQAKFPHLAPQRGEPFHFFSSAPDALLTAVPELRAKIAAAANEVKGGSAEVALRLLTDATKQIDSASSKTAQMSMLHQSEDRTFCSRATEAGHPTHVDFAVCCGHVGPHVFHHQNTTAK